MSRRLSVILLAAGLLLATSLPALEVPSLRGRVNDLAGMISGAAEAQLEAKLKALETSDSTQVVVLTVPSLEGEPLEEYSLRVAETWALGQGEYDNGALLLVSKGDRKVRIEVGYGLEGVLTDLLAGRIIDQVILPNFKAGRFDEGFLLGVEGIIQSVKGEYVGRGESPVPTRRSSSRGTSLLPFVILIIFISMVGSKRRIIGALAMALFLPLMVWFFLPLGLVAILLMIPFGFLGGLIIPVLPFFSGAGRFRHFGGFSSGGGFSGGGGGFGGGGASGGW